MSQPSAIYLLEADAAPGGGPVSADALRLELAAHPDLWVIGLVDVPVDEAVLCLVGASSEAGEAAVGDLARRYGPAARLLRVAWAPAPVEVPLLEPAPDAGLSP